MPMPVVHIADLLRRVRSKSPLVHHITNGVTMSECANAVKSLGASPVMAWAPEETADMTALADALVLNIGTPTRGQAESMKLSGRAASRKGIPVILDACGAGATVFRNDLCAELLASFPVAVVKGNASEIAAVAGVTAATRGVDAGEVHGDLDGLVVRLARSRNLTVVMTGAVDRVSDGRHLVHVDNGHPRMARVVGTGCMAASMLGVFCAVERDPLTASVAAMALFGLAGEMAAAGTPGPGSYRAALFDALDRLDPDSAASGARLEIHAVDALP